VGRAVNRQAHQSSSVVSTTRGGDTARYLTLGRLARARGQNILFSPSRRAIYLLNDTAACIWQSLEDGLSPAAVAANIASSGVDAPEADRHVERALESWQRLGLIRPDLPVPLTPVGDRSTQLIAIQGLAVRIVCPGTLELAAAVFRHLGVESSAPGDRRLEVIEHRGRVHLLRNGEWLKSCVPAEVPTVLIGQVLTEILEHATYQLALHGAALLRSDRLLVLCGAPGAGKTTLGLALLGVGFGYAADDVILLEPRGRAVGLPFAPAVKAGAWPILAECLPYLASTPIFRRLDGRRVRYPVPRVVVAARAWPVGWIVLLSRGDGRAAIERVDPGSALQGVLHGAFAPDGELTAGGFEALTHLIRSAEVYRLTYSRLEDAVALLDEACR
jgi:Coenzyme PQQ synthesis protein D (PqqD)